MSNSFITPLPPIPVDEYKNDPDLVRAVEKATTYRDPIDPTKNCAPTITETTEDLSDAQKKTLSETMGMLGIGKCETTQAGVKVELQASLPLTKASGSATANFQTQSGCEQVNVISNIVSQCTQQLSCLLNEIQATSTTNIRVFQEITLNVGDISNAKVKLGNLSETDVRLVNIAQSTVQSAIGATLTQGIQSAVDQSLDVVAGPHSDATSQKNMTQILQNLQSVASNTTVNKSVASTTASIYKDQKITLNAGNITGGEIDIANVDKFKMISENYVYNALDQLFKTDQVQSALNEIVQTTTATKKGALDSIINNVGFGIVEIIIGGIVIVLLVMLYYYFFGRKKKQKKKKQVVAQAYPV